MASKGTIPFWAPGDGLYIRDNTDEALWSRIKIGGVTLPGIAVVSGKVKNKVDMVDVPGQDGVSVSHLGYDGADAEATITMWTKDQLALYLELVKKLRPRKLKSTEEPSAVSVEHPALEIFGIRSLYILEWTLPEPGAKPGTYESKITFVEYIKKTDRRGSTKGKGKPKKVDAAPINANVNLTAIPTVNKPSAGKPKP